MEIQEVKEQLKEIFRTVINNDKWITIHPHGEDEKGRYLLLKDGESPKEAIERTYGKSEKSETKEGKEEKKSTFKPVKGIMQSLKDDYEAGKINAKEVAKELSKANLTPYLLDDNEALEKIGVKQSDSKGDKKEDKVAETKILEGGVKESTDEHGRIIYSKKNSNKKVKIHKNGNFYLASYGQELKDDDGYTEFQVFPSASGKSFKTEEGARRWALKQLNVNNDKEQDMALLEELKKLITKVENTKGEEDMEIKNEKVDKRKLIDEVAGIMKSAGCDDEVIRTAIGKMEKMSYDDSEKSADNECEAKEDVKNCGKKVKNEDEEGKKEVKEIEEDVKEDVENRGKKNIKNSKTDYFAKLNEIYNSAANALEKCEYVSRADREKAAEDYFAR